MMVLSLSFRNKKSKGTKSGERGGQSHQKLLLINCMMFTHRVVILMELPLMRTVHSTAYLQE